MKHVSIVLLIVMVSLTSCAVNQEKEIAEETKSSFFQPEPLDDEWNKWLVGEWDGGFKIEFGLNRQFLIMKGEAETGEMTPDQIKYLKGGYLLCKPKICLSYKIVHYRLY